MLNENKYYIPKYIDEPFRVIFFTLDECAIVGTILGFSFAIGHEAIGFVAALGAYLGYSKLKGKESSSFLLRSVYWYLGFGPSGCVPKAKQRKFKG